MNCAQLVFSPIIQFRHNLPHAAGLIMISLAYYQYFMDKGCCPDRFVRIAKALGKADAQNPQEFITALTELRKSCSVDALKLSDYSFQPEEFDGIVR